MSRRSYQKTRRGGKQRGAKATDTTVQLPLCREELVAIKQPFSKSIRQILSEDCTPLLDRLMVRERPGKTCFRFWQEGPGFDRNLFSPEVIASSLGYIHNTPVQRGLR